MALKSRFRGTLRNRILAFVSSLILLSLLGSTFSLYRITEVNRSLDGINHVSIPLGRLFVQMQSDSSVLKHELDRRMGRAHWSDAHWKARPLPKWIEDLIQSEISRVSDLVSVDLPWSTPESKQRLKAWIEGLAQKFGAIREDAEKLYGMIEKGDQESAGRMYPLLVASVEEWGRQLNWGVGEYERAVRHAFSEDQSSVSELRTGLEIILIVVVSLSFLMLWLGERALRPLSELTRMAAEIARRGLRKEDKSKLPGLVYGRNDEVSQLSREFHNMATALLEREKTVETQKHRLLEQNRLLAEMGELNQNVLNSIESILLVTDLNGKITQCNPVASAWLNASDDKVIGTDLKQWPTLRDFAELLPKRDEKSEEAGRSTFKLGDKHYGVRVMPLKRGDAGEVSGAIIVLDDLTAELDMQDRLRRAENLAAVGRLSAQVAHEVRNPLHSIGLEAELAAELASRFNDNSLKHSLQSILVSVDRLDKITENYLKLSRLSAGEKKFIDLGEVLESVLATYASACEAEGVSVDWSREPGSSLFVSGDRDLIEQALGNLFRNSLQALKEDLNRQTKPRIAFKLGNAESGRVWLRIEDNGPGIAPTVRERLFTPFVTTKAQGTGLGLSFVKKVIEDHGGAVRCVARDGEVGACFEIALPQTVLMSEVETARPPTHPGSEARLDG